jgi:hypothetical protein
MLEKCSNFHPNRGLLEEEIPKIHPGASPDDSKLFSWLTFALASNVRMMNWKNISFLESRYQSSLRSVFGERVVEDFPWAKANSCTSGNLPTTANMTQKKEFWEPRAESAIKHRMGLIDAVSFVVAGDSIRR